jgi:hypothetical protein
MNSKITDPAAARRLGAPLPGQVVYLSLDGTVSHWPGSGPWDPGGRFPTRTLDLLHLRAEMGIALRKIEDELDARGLLRRITAEADAATRAAVEE